jgi:hypothetical protein
MTMNVSETEDTAVGAARFEPTAVLGPAELEHEECEQCRAPVERLQRYCVNCGAHRRHVPDPAARYLAQASARARAAGSAAGQARSVRTSIRPVTAALLAAIIAGGGVAVGAAVNGGSSSGDNAQLIREIDRLEARHPATAGGHSSRTTGAGDRGGESLTRKLQHATGSNYVKQAQQLPNSVAIP